MGFPLPCAALSICHGACCLLCSFSWSNGKGSSGRRSEPAHAWQKGNRCWDSTSAPLAFLPHQCSAAVIISVFLLPSFGVIPSTPLAIHTPLMPNQSIDVSLPLNTLGPVMKMEPLNNLQVRIVSWAGGGESAAAQLRSFGPTQCGNQAPHIEGNQVEPEGCVNVGHEFG